MAELDYKGKDFFSSSWSDCGFSTGHKARLDNCFRKLDGYLEIVLDEHYNLESTRKGDDDEEDLVDALIRLSNQENGLMSPLSKEQIKAMLMNTFLGGAGTSSIVIINWRSVESAQLGISDKNEVDYRGQHFEFVPFGGGSRIRPGISNSIATIELTLANLLCWFD
ncbi:hypothetical protein MIMGU_mgv1a019935mg [Erythranthe guttata]|uniref:Uncharacterized protein n=1 Tax=Erythranthe guttata TaxID=4155 RepID=A0A022Q7R6_ERYGU|nr:hypothetical protein MIMGU_mgv1a019935mg [Erythranthe guttata]